MKFLSILILNFLLILNSFQSLVPYWLDDIFLNITDRHLEYTYVDTRQDVSIQYPTIQIYGSNLINVRAPAILPKCLSGFSRRPDGSFFCIQDTSKNQRPAYEQDCLFPFQYKGVWYDRCISIDSSYFWCSLNKVFLGNFAICEQSCPILARSLMTGVDAGKPHSSCLEPQKGVSPLFPNNSQIQIIVDFHNRVRSNIMWAADLRQISWDFDVARLAQRKAETCTFSHDCFNCRRLVNNRTLSIGQNAYMAWGNIGSNLDDIWKNVISSWSNEISLFRYGGPQSGVVGHYTQIVNSLVSRVGCGAARCGSSFYAYCNYVGAQMDMNKPYTLGSKPCNMCPSSICENNLCKCDKVCQNAGVLDLSTCTCRCPAFTTGDSCEFLTCNKTDVEYGCWARQPSDCIFSNFPAICPNLCGLCLFR